MIEVSAEQIRNFRLCSHHLDRTYPESEAAAAVGACGIQNSPPGAWETALFNRVPSLSREQMNCSLYKERNLIQAWSFRGAPVVFPVEESDVFLTALISRSGEPWIYTPGILTALDFLQMTFDELLESLKQVMPQLDETVITGKTALDQTLAEWMLPLIPAGKRDLWNRPSMYGNPEKQTVGGAVVSFLLRPCAFSGLVVFGERSGISPSFTSYKRWTGHPLISHEDAEKKLVRKFLHCYGPATADHFMGWLGCSRAQAKRLWEAVSEELEPVKALGKKAYLLSEDRERFFSPPPIRRELLLLGAHDPYLDQRDRLVLQPEKGLHRQIWKLVGNPGAVVYRGEIIGTWTGRKKGRGMEIKMTLWAECGDKKKLKELAKERAEFLGEPLLRVEM